MGLIPWRNKRKTEPAADGGMTLPSIGSLRREMDRLFSRFFDDPWAGFDTPLASFSGWTPSLDVVDGEKEVTVRVDLPGVDPKDVDVSMSGNVLTISGEKKSEHEEKGRGFFRSERTFGAFRRQVALPEGVDAERVSADHANGVLTIRLAKARSAVPRKITITKR